jgi:hypothetical protein
MGLSEQDYLHERRDGDTNVLQFRPAPRKTSFMTVVLCLVVTLSLLYKAALWWQDKPSQKSMSARPSAVVSVETPQRVEPPSISELSAQQARIQPNQPPAAGTVSKCVVNGRVTYSDVACPKEAAVGSVKLVPAVPREGSEQPKAVPPLPVVAQQSGTTLAPQPTLHTPVQATPAKATECKYLDELVKQIDVQALQPLTLQQQDLLRGDRKKARDRQFFLGC